MKSDSHDKTARPSAAGLSLAEALAEGNGFAHLRVAAVKNPRGGPYSTLRMPVPDDIAADLQRISRGNAFLTWTAFVSSTAMYLSRYGRTNTVLLSIPQRRTGKVADACHPVLLHVNDDLNFRDHLQYCRTRLLATQEEQPQSAEQLRKAGLNSPGSESPIQIGIAHAEIHNTNWSAPTDIEIVYEQTLSELRASVRFHAGLFTTHAMTALLQHQFAILRQGLQQPDRKLCELAVTGAPDAHVATGIEAKGAQQHFLTLFDELVNSQPDVIAIREPQGSISYQELDRRARQIAALLQGHGISEEEIVGVAMNRTANAIAAILGIWKAGAAYLPCDPKLPANRLSQMLEDARARVVLSDGSFTAVQGTATVLQIDAETLNTCSPNVQKHSLRRLDRLAYVIYTSGSTGKPKGVLLTHKGLANLVRAQLETFSCEECTEVLQFSAHSFDASIFDITMALAHGGTLHMSGDLQIPTGEQLLTVLEAGRITLATVPPCVLATLPEGKVSSLRTVVVAGEACSQALVDKWAGRVRLVNAYGPTETTVWATYEECRRGMPVMIGRTIPGIQAHILDQHLHPVPSGFPGELCLSGDGLARGFVGSPAMTAQRFIPDPLSQISGGRLYRTGDLAVFGSDGRIEFLGRNDHQLKIRGYRIELGEIQALLSRHPAVAQVAITTKDSPAGSTSLVAFIVPLPEVQLSPEELEDYASHHLPDYMVPSQFVFLTEIPLTRSGKVDSKRLLEIQQSSSPRTGKERPANQMEEMLARIWSELLHVDSVAPSDNFFQLGGHSLLAIQVVSRIKKLYGVNLHPRSVFEAPTIRAMSDRIAEATRTPEQGTASPAEPVRVCEILAAR